MQFYSITKIATECGNVESIGTRTSDLRRDEQVTKVTCFTVQKIPGNRPRVFCMSIDAQFKQ